MEYNFAAVSVAELFNILGTRPEGLHERAVERRLRKYGKNELAVGREAHVLIDLLTRLASPLIILLIVIALFAYFFGDRVSALVVSAMIVMSVGLSFFQERRAKRAARQLGEIVQTMCMVMRDGVRKEVPLRDIVPGDVVVLSAGDVLPGDVRIIESKNLFVNQSVLTGESFPAEKHTAPVPHSEALTPHTPDMAFMGTSVMSGEGLGVVVATGRYTEFGLIAQKLAEEKAVTAFDRQINEFVRAMIVMIIAVAVAIIGIRLLKHEDLVESLFFALALAVQITPETLPVIITLNLSRGALAMAKKKVVVKRLNAIQNLGAMDVLCTDKTGTLTMNEVILERHVDVSGKDDESVFIYGYINSYYQTGIRNLLNGAILKHKREDLHAYTKVDEVPFDFERKINSVAVKRDNDLVFIAVGAPEEIMKRCVNYYEHGGAHPFDGAAAARMVRVHSALSGEGFRVLAVAYRHIEEKKAYGVADESSLTLKGFMAFLDPPKPTAREAVRAIENAGVTFKVITGDNELVTKKICIDLGIPADVMLEGSQLETMNDAELARHVEHTSIFARVTPKQKERIVRALIARGHTVGYLGDGINDALSLRAADVGISVNNAVDVAKESAGIVLLEKDLDVLMDGVREGRKVYGNFVKYIRMTSMVNVGYMLTTLFSSVFLPFLPMAPVQMLLNNYLYEIGQTGIPGDNVDKEYIARPKTWHIRSILLFMVTLGPLASFFDLIMFCALWWVLGAGMNEQLFQTGWFLEATLAQMLLIFVIRTRKLPFVESRPSKLLFGLSFVILIFVFALPFTPLAASFRLVPMSLLYYPLAVGVVGAYLATVWYAKNWFIQRITGS